MAEEKKTVKKAPAKKAAAPKAKKETKAKKAEVKAEEVKTEEAKVEKAEKKAKKAEKGWANTHRIITKIEGTEQSKMISTMMVQKVHVFTYAELVILLKMIFIKL